MEPVSADDDAGVIVFNLHAHLPETAEGGEAVGPLEEIFDFGDAGGDGAEHDAAVGDGFIPRHGQLAPEMVGFFYNHFIIL